jgi:hypothetical protein
MIYGSVCVAELNRRPEKTAKPDREDFTAFFGGKVQR